MEQKEEVSCNPSKWKNNTKYMKLTNEFRCKNKVVITIQLQKV